MRKSDSISDEYESNGKLGIETSFDKVDLTHSQVSVPFPSLVFNTELLS